MSGSVPNAEAERLAALEEYAILDTPAEPGFDDIVRIASQICGTPMALISLVDDRRQWFKAVIGLAETETPREVAFCAHAIEQRGVFEVGDATADPRFSDNPLVTGGLGLRFYAGAPLETPDGHALGTLCVLDDKPRSLSTDQHAALQALARQVMAQLELKRTLALLREEETHRTVMLDELRHRVRNMLAVVQAIVSQTLRNAPGPGEARATIDERLRSLASAHDLLTRTDWVAAPIDAIISTATAVHAGFTGQITAAGGPLMLGPRAALALAMVLHELTTNAIKYGALSVPEGQVSIGWQAESEAADAPVTIKWIEAHGPATTAPTKVGFGSRLIGKILPADMRGTAKSDFRPEGFRWTLTTTRTGLAG